MLKKVIFSAGLFLVTVNALFAQQYLKITGSVVSEKGAPIPYAFVRERPAKNAVYADSAGNFAIKVNGQSYLEVTSPGYNAANVILKGTDTYQVTLQSIAATAATSGQAPGAGFHTNVLSQHTTADNSNQTFAATEGAVFAAKQKEDAHGSSFFFDDWVHGYFINLSDSLAQNPAYLYNYNKITGDLLITKDKATALQANPAELKSITLFNNSGTGFTFEKVTAVDPGHFVLLIASGNKYDIYKRIVTHFKKSDYSSNGISSSGNNYDEYVDDYTYYIYNVKTNAVQKVALKKKAIKEAFAADEEKVNAYFKTNDGDIDESYLHDLGDYMNK
jgi:hypothetical protein